MYVYFLMVGKPELTSQKWNFKFWNNNLNLMLLFPSYVILKPIHAQGLFLEGLNPYFIIQIGNIFS